MGGNVSRLSLHYLLPLYYQNLLVLVRLNVSAVCLCRGKPREVQQPLQK